MFHFLSEWMDGGALQTFALHIWINQQFCWIQATVQQNSKGNLGGEREVKQ